MQNLPHSRSRIPNGKPIADQLWTGFELPGDCQREVRRLIEQCFEPDGTMPTFVTQPAASCTAPPAPQRILTAL
jgi:hypothetical protein